MILATNRLSRISNFVLVPKFKSIVIDYDTIVHSYPNWRGVAMNDPKICSTVLWDNRQESEYLLWKLMLTNLF